MTPRGWLLMSASMLETAGVLTPNGTGRSARKAAALLRELATITPDSADADAMTECERLRDYLRAVERLAEGRGVDGAEQVVAQIAADAWAPRPTKKEPQP